MKELTDREKRDWLVMRIFAVAIGICAPLIYLLIARTGVTPARVQPGADLLFYILLVMGAVQPLVLPLVEKAQMAGYRRSITRLTPAKMYLNLAIVRLAVCEAIFVYGLVVYFLSTDFSRMLWFYPIGAIWMVIYWPRKEKYAAFIEEMQADAGRA